MKFASLRLALAGSLISCVALANAQVIWNESINGDLSGDRLNPNNLTLSFGSNQVIGSMGGADKEYVHFHLASGMQLVAINVVAYVSGDDFAFIGVQAGSTFTEPASGADPSNLLGWTLWGTNQIGQDILPAMGQGSQAQGFTPPLGGSDYTFWIQQTGDPTDYTLDFVTAPVPEPATMTALGIGALALIKRRRRK